MKLRIDSASPIEPIGQLPQFYRVAFSAHGYTRHKLVRMRIEERKAFARDLRRELERRATEAARDIAMLMDRDADIGNVRAELEPADVAALEMLVPEEQP